MTCLLATSLFGGFGQTTTGAASAEVYLNQAYKALGVKDYDSAIVLFRKGLSIESTNATAHKDLAYTLLKTGDNAEARDEFERALQVNSHDESAALEFAFLAYETKKPIEARQMFDRLRHSANAGTRTTAEQAFQNIDRPLKDGIARWKEALSRVADPNALSTFSAHWELAQLAELRDELPLAAEQFAICRKLKPQLPELLLIQARIWRQLNQVEESQAALLAASRSRDSRTAELAVEQFGTRYPYPYEFVAALKLDPQNVALRKELAYLYLAMGKEPEAKEQFEAVLAIDPKDQAVRKQLDLLRGLKTRNSSEDKTAPIDAKAMGQKSLAMGYLHDAVKFLEQAHEQNPEDAEVMLQLGWAYNQSKDDAEALDWFNRARRADDPQIAAEASKAFHNLRGDTPQTTIWALPMFSSRWKDLFSYGQMKRTVLLPWLGKTNNFISFYLTVRFSGDVKGSVPTQVITPQYLSESAFVFGAGMSTKTWHHLTGWAEAGEGVKYLPSHHDVGAAIPDYRGGLNYTKGFGTLLGDPKSGFFYETTADAEYISRFDKDWLFYSQHRAGRTLRFANGASGQLLLNVNYVRDTKNEYWANTVEVGPGFKFRMPWMPPSMYLSTDFLHGMYTGYSPKPNYNDIRVSVWYAVTK
ncbi:MAG: tetratricopeptide repeat protein [Acidobacteriota bacterium]|nr:tetratricopeptide repeat protein [Acidobacteriota bacterium]